MNANVSKVRRWTKKDAWSSALLFLLNLFILLLIVAALLMGSKIGNLKQTLIENRANYLYIGFCVFLLAVISYLYFFFEERSILTDGKNILLVFAILDLSLVLCVLTGKWLNIYARPVALCALLTFTAGMVAIFAANRLKSRIRVVLVGLFIALPMDFMIFLLEISSLAAQGTSFNQAGAARAIWINLGYGFIGGISSAILVLTLLPVFEAMFSMLTVFRLRELTSLDAPLLKKLKDEAPGTYNHSAVVSQLAEECAAALGEDAELARAAALYHDVGKLHHPEYFTENQGDYNLHDELTPELSADIIRSHTTYGYDLILANHLPQFFADVAIQHHGTLTIRYFYSKALKMYGGNVNKEDFSYRGPKPQSKIAAIIMIADASEAAVRSIGNKTPEEVEKRVRDLIEDRMNQEQFAECDITMADLTVVKQTLVNALTGVYHKRVDYPSIHYGKKDEE